MSGEAVIVSDKDCQITFDFYPAEDEPALYLDIGVFSVDCTSNVSLNFEVEFGNMLGIE
jgi:hypothetical protein